MNFAIRFKQLRRELDYTQEELADFYNKKYYTTFNKSTISQYENGKRLPDLDTISNWADLFDVSIDYLAGKTDIKEINRTKPSSLHTDITTMAAHKADLTQGIKNIDGLKDLLREIVKEELGK
ncbi:HTH-type transcriptional regulator immR [Peptostreptococcus anaerobius]|uniref:HTH-type transcriptional regulator immR n=1 Tax=Peptostreptococcus anaerobius TaxID=1261 RepID=A0A379CH67_9FIRM|nr:helix-turn-helix transcriptional regulator [Peptostreptococcus anaerobius]EKX89329.1 DNA-binding helix-turn-helix protein [Peptostreptococcus anaerobius VPI 4330 = DSM 2949]SFM70816.1 DNA-binding transcriptional regulator, XRE-family HTH domain [Peptostreptococcus anaerobius]SUB60987.1 HTH-type transcriptional regulator immR [Peptostreptococcus anaerobius]